MNRSVVIQFIKRVQMSRYYKIDLATFLAITLLLGLVIFHFNDELFYGNSSISNEESELDFISPDLEANPDEYSS